MGRELEVYILKLHVLRFYITNSLSRSIVNEDSNLEIINKNSEV